PGFGGQSFMPCGLEKIKQLSLEKKKNGYDYIIEVDGGINEETASQCAENGAEMLVAGSYVFGNKDIKTAIDTIKNADS
ncbi:MAG: ribulose-phosphate 3-epimerase, partial [Oscillospiraceae bacterium]